MNKNTQRGKKLNIKMRQSQNSRKMADLENNKREILEMRDQVIQIKSVATSTWFLTPFCNKRNPDSSEKCSF